MRVNKLSTTRRNVHSLEMQIGAADSLTLTLTLALDLLNPESISFDIVSRTNIL